MQINCNALIVELPDGRIVLSAIVVSRKYLTQDQINMLDKVGVDKSMKYNTQYNLTTPKDKVHIIVMEE